MDIFVETERLTLRRITQSDFSELSIMLKNPNVMYAWEYQFTDLDVQDWIDKCLEYYEKYNLGYFIMEDKKIQKIVGQAALMPDTIDNEKYYEIGYILKEEYLKKGYADEAAKALADFAFNKLDLNSVIFEIRPENTPSRRVAEKQGAKITGEFVKNVHGKQMKHLIYTLVNPS